jgi:hypothetical protein
MMLVVVQHEKQHFTRSYFLEYRVRHQCLVEITFSPTIQSSSNCFVYTRPPRKKLGSALGDCGGINCGARDVGSWRLGTPRELCAVGFANFIVAPRNGFRAPKKQLEQPRWDRQAAGDGANGNVKVLQVLRGCPRRPDAKYKFILRERTEEHGNVMLDSRQRAGDLGT